MEQIANFLQSVEGKVLFGIALAALLLALVLVAVLARWGSYWIQAYMSGAKVSMVSLIVMSLLKLDHRKIVSAIIMARKAGLPFDRNSGVSTARLQAHSLAGGDVTKVVLAIIAAHRAKLDLDFERASAIDLAGRDVLHAVQTSILPQVIHCPMRDGRSRKALSAVAKNGVELLVEVYVTVRTNLGQLIGGATEETVIARVGQGIVTTIGSAASHMDVLESPSTISVEAMSHGLDANTAFTIVSIDVAHIDVGENIGARLRSDQAEADIRIARARAEVRRTEAVAEQQRMRARVAENHAAFVLAEAEVPSALANAFRLSQNTDTRLLVRDRRKNSTLRNDDERVAS